MNDIYVWQPEGQPVGPYTTESLARAIADGSVAKDAFVAPPGAAQWQHAAQLPEVLVLAESMARAKSPSILPPRSPTSVAPAIPAAPKVPRASQAPRAPQAPKPPRPPLASQSGVRPAPSAPPPNADDLLPMPSDAAPGSSIAALSAALTPAPMPTPLTPAPAPALPPTPAPAPAPAILRAPSIPEAPVVPSPPARPSPAATAAMPAMTIAVAEAVKPAEDKPKPRPWPKWLPVAVFGAFFALSLIELAVGLALAPRDTLTAEVGKGASSGAPAAAPR